MLLRPTPLSRAITAFAILAASVAFSSTVRAQAGRASLTLCNDSQRHTLNAAVVHRNIGLGGMLNGYPWTGAGWQSIRPGACSLVLSNFGADDLIWLRLEAKNRVLPATSQSNIWTGVQVRESGDHYCINPQNKFSWRRRDDHSLQRCAEDAGLAVFPVLIRVTKNTDLTLRTNPDSAVETLKPETVSIDYQTWLAQTPEGYPPGPAQLPHDQVPLTFKQVFDIGPEVEIARVFDAEPARRDNVQQHLLQLKRAGAQMVQCFYGPFSAGGVGGDVGGWFWQGRVHATQAALSRIALNHPLLRLGDTANGCPPNYALARAARLAALTSARKMALRGATGVSTPHQDVDPSPAPAQRPTAATTPSVDDSAKLLKQFVRPFKPYDFVRVPKSETTLLALAERIRAAQQSVLGCKYGDATYHEFWHQSPPPQIDELILADRHRFLSGGIRTRKARTECPRTEREARTAVGDHATSAR
ncbi:MAG: DUF1036 domain-containing protein [Rubrivivax sp.]|nr:DUF1036 domain-containing protein [Rubrivivax sp.]